MPAAPADSIELDKVVSGLTQPLLVTHANDGSDRLFVVEQGGRILVLSGGSPLEQPFLDVSSEISTDGERGLLGLAFHPRYPENGFFFVNYTDRRGDSVVSRFSVSSDGNRADPASEVEVLSFNQPFSNHNGGHLAFGPDGNLYIATGDGGGAGDPQNNGQSRDTLLGKILRVDVDGLPFAIPPDNPFVGQGGQRDEIWALGLRNPWRFSFDRRTGDLFIGDVGQSREEEIDFQPAGSSGGENYGWRRMEGSLCFEPPNNCQDSSFTSPILVYGHDSHCSVTGGYRYRGKSNAALEGMYVFGDFCSGIIWGAEPGPDGIWFAVVLADTNLAITSFGEDESGELYVVDRRGSIFQVAGSALLLDDFETADTSTWKRAKGNVAVVEPGLRGSGHALEVTLDGGGTESVVISAAIRRESALTLRFLFDANLVDLDGQAVDILHLVGSGGTAARLVLQPRGTRYRVSMWVMLDTGEEILVGNTNVKRVGATRLGLEWSQASSPQASNGVARLLKGRRARGERSDLTNGSVVVRFLEVGLPDGSRSAIGGALRFDDFLVRR